MNKDKGLRWLECRRVCVRALEWVRETDNPCVATCQRGEWLLWLAGELGVDALRLKAAVYPAVKRALLEYAPTALEAASMHDEARRLRREAGAALDLEGLTAAAENAEDAARKEAEWGASTAKNAMRATWAALESTSTSPRSAARATIPAS